MNKIIIFNGSNREFSNLVPKDNRTLSDVVMELDNDQKKSIVIVKGLPNATDDDKEEKIAKLEVENFVINSDEYSGVREHVIINFANFIAKMNIANMYIQNPPLHISEQLYRIYGEGIIEKKAQSYEKISKDALKQIFSRYDEVIIGQERAKMALLQALYPLINKELRKPVVILFYGDSGVGKTETAQFLARLLNGKLFRKQFSMFQNNQFATYLFGGTHNEGSFAKDLLDRDSNVILLDEFDKANTVFHSAFYQLFDEGIYEDRNYMVNMQNAVIICTSNYLDEEEIKKHLGNAIYNRFDSIIGFEELSIEAKSKIGDREINKAVLEYRINHVELDEKVLERLKEITVQCSNAREIQHLIKNTFALAAIRQICH